MRWNIMCFDICYPILCVCPLMSLKTHQQLFEAQQVWLLQEKYCNICELKLGLGAAESLFFAGILSYCSTGHIRTCPGDDAR